jgi:putative transposase
MPFSSYCNSAHRAVKRRVRPMLGFKSMASARATLGGIEMVHMMRKGQTKYAQNRQSLLADQFEQLVA